MTTPEPFGTDGMTGVPLAPFPFLNPFNWPALAPAHAWAASFFMLHCGMEGWRNIADVTRAILREQQDAALKALETQCTPAAEPAASSTPRQPAPAKPTPRAIVV